MIRSLIHTGERTHLQETTPDRIDAQVGNGDRLLWVDLQDPSPSDFECVERTFKFHGLALEDARMRHERPKIDAYDDFYFLVLYELDVKSGETMSVTHTEISIFLGKDYLVTVHYGRSTALEEAASRWPQLRDDLGPQPSVLLYGILDSTVDQYFDVLDVLSDRLDTIEDRIFEKFDRHLSRQILELRKELLGVRRVLAPERDVVNTLLRRDLPLFPAELTAYLQDVYDHIILVTESIDTYRDLLSGTMDAYLSTVSNELNQVMKGLTVAATILMSMSLVAGIYGMNFAFMPELQQPLGYPGALALMLLIAVVMGVYFRRRGWL